MRTYILIAFFSICFYTNSFSQKKEPCNNLKIESKITATSNGQNNGSIELMIEGGVKPFKISVIGDKRSKNKLDVDATNIQNLEKGQYLVIVQDKAGCRKELNIEIK